MQLAISIPPSVPSIDLYCFFVYYNTMCSFLMVLCLVFFQIVLFYNINFHLWFDVSIMYNICVVVFYNGAFSTQLCLVNLYFLNFLHNNLHEQFLTTFSRIKLHAPTEVILEFYKPIINSLSKKDKSILVQTFVCVLLSSLFIFGKTIDVSLIKF